MFVANTCRARRNSRFYSRPALIQLSVPIGHGCCGNLGSIVRPWDVCKLDTTRKFRIDLSSRFIDLSLDFLWLPARVAGCLALGTKRSLCLIKKLHNRVVAASLGRLVHCRKLFCFKRREFRGFIIQGPVVGPGAMWDNMI